MASLQSVYDKSPVWFQHIMTTGAGLQKNRRRYSKEYWVYRKFLEGFDTWPLEKKFEYRDEELRRFVAYAAENSDFYKDLYIGLDLDKIQTSDDLSRLPIVGKEMLRANMESVHTVSRRTSTEGHTGGTTGKSLVVRSTHEDSMKRMAQLDHFKARHGFENRRMRRATFMGKHIVPPGSKKPSFWRYNAASKQMLYSTFHITEENLPRYVQSLNHFKPQALDGFFTSMVDVASYILRNDIKLEFRPVAIFPTSETVTQGGRELLEKAFGTKVYDQYASSEGAPFVTECASGILHVEPSSGIFERRNDRTNEILVTSFTSHGTPLIRYAIGDSMILGPDVTCECGLESPTVLSIEGRNDDFLYRPDGAKINGGNVANLFKNLPNVVIRAQLRQERIDAITIVLEVDQAAFQEQHEEMLREEFAHKFGPESQLTIQIVDEIPRAASGKHRLIVNEIARQRR